MPTSKVDDPDSLFTGWMLLSYRKAATASSTMGEFARGRASPTRIRRPSGSRPQNKPGETLTVDLGRSTPCARSRSNFADYKSGRFADAPDIYTEFALQASSDGQHWQEVARTEPPRRDRPNAYFELAAAGARALHPLRPRPCRRGEPRDQRHSRVRQCRRAALRRRRRASSATRHQDQRDATIRWAKVPGAVGYNIRFGIRPDRLTLTHQLWADELGNGATLQKELRSLNVGVPYWVAVEAFNETGVSKLSRVVPIR